MPARVLALCALGCGARPHAAPAETTTDEVTLYRDRALVKQRVELAVPSSRATIAVRVAAGVSSQDIAILDRGGLGVELRAVHAVTEEPPPARADEPADDPLEIEPAPAPPRAVATSPTELELTIAAPHPGRFAISLAYITDRLAWDAAYTMTTTPARERAVLRGAVAIRNTSGIVFHARTYAVDGELGAWRMRAAEQLAAALTGEDAPAAMRPRELGLVTLGDGETRVELLAGDPPRRLRSVLVYDPIGTRLDHPGAAPISDPAFGTDAAVPSRVTESFEVARSGRGTAGLPAGPVRMLERRRDGSLGVLGESRLFEPATRVAHVDSVAIGTADGVVGHRERRDWARDDDQRRFSEEFLLTIDNARSRPVEVVLREHLYRGQNWVLAYQSAPAVKEGPQQIALRTLVPANGRARVLYVVVYTW